MDTEAIEFGDRTLYLREVDAVVCADVHLGRGATAPVEFPLREEEQIIEIIQPALEQYTPETIVLAGDILHAFHTVPAGVEDALGSLIDLADQYGATPIFITGNHDQQLQAISPIPTQEHWQAGHNVVVHHGHTNREIDAGLEIVGHSHPMITIEGQRRPCFLYDPEATPPLVVLPPVNPLLPGVPVNTARTSELPGPVVESITRVRPIVYDADSHTSLEFPPLGEFRTLL